MAGSCDKVTGFFLCQSCLEFFGGYGEQGCVWCKSYDFFQVDEVIAPSILLLNKKGYKTTACCSGHIYYSSGYIRFEEQYSLPSPPDGFYIDIDDNSLRWNTHDYKEDEHLRMLAIQHKAGQLNNYVKELPEVSG